MELIELYIEDGSEMAVCQWHWARDCTGIVQVPKTELFELLELCLENGLIMIVTGATGEETLCWLFMSPQSQSSLSW